MATFEDGSYSCLPGIALIGKVLAGRCQMKYTRAAVGYETQLWNPDPTTYDVYHVDGGGDWNCCRRHDLAIVW